MGPTPRRAGRNGANTDRLTEWSVGTRVENPACGKLTRPVPGSGDSEGDSVTALDRSSTVAVVGAGTMGQGIAQVALLAGHRVLLHDAAPGRARAAAHGVAGRLDRLVAKGR